MKTGSIILIPFPFVELINTKIRPSVIIAFTNDKFKDVIISAISSVVPEKLSQNEIIIEPTNYNNLRVKSVIKIDRIVTLKKTNIITELGNLTDNELMEFKEKFKGLVD